MSEIFIEARGLGFAYEGQEQKALSNLSFQALEGQHLAILGRNGSGKSTLARLINALELPQEGTLVVAGMEASDEEQVWQIRRLCGMVFQNPDNQIVASTVEEDVAFGPENLGVPQAELRQRVDTALSYVGLSDYAQAMPSELSGGQKQKLAIAGILAMYPRCIILDESTSMLDPLSRRAFMELILRIRQEVGLTVINITHDMEEALLADQILLMSAGQVLQQGAPEEIFCEVERLRELALDVPAQAAICYDLYRRLGRDVPAGLRFATESGAQEAILRLVQEKEQGRLASVQAAAPPRKTDGLDGRAGGERVAGSSRPLLEVRGLGYSYEPQNKRVPRVLQDINFELYPGEILGIMGHSGSGKSTLVQQLNGVLPLQEGRIRVLDYDLSQRRTVRDLRRHIGLLFQYPEHQLFAPTVEEDIMFGPLRMGTEEAEARRLAREASALLGLDPALLERSPFELSGGQKRRVAIAGILAMQPEILILDEPAAGLDPAGREEMLEQIRRLRSQGRSVILVSHSMEDLAKVSDRILLLYHGRQILLDRPEAIFARGEELAQYYILPPASQRFMQGLAPLLPGFEADCYTEDQAVQALLEYLEVC